MVYTVCLQKDQSMVYTVCHQKEQSNYGVHCVIRKSSLWSTLCVIPFKFHFFREAYGNNFWCTNFYTVNLP